MIPKVSATAFNCREIYGTVAIKHKIVIKAPKNLLLPYRNDMKSAIDDILCCFEIRMILPCSPFSFVKGQLLMPQYSDKS